MYLRSIALIAVAVFSLTVLSAQTSSPQQVPASVPTPAPAQKTSLLYTTPTDPIVPEKKEDWTTLSVEKSGLPLSDIGGVVLSKIERPEFTRELIRLKWRPGDPIDIYVIRPHGVAKPPVILYLYNYTSDIDRFRDDGWDERATKGGFAAIGFVSALSGQRFHAPRPLKQWFVSQLQEALASSTHDVQMILNYLATRGDIDMGRVGMFGQASGGSIALLAAATDPRIKAVDVMDPWGDWPDWLKDSPQIPEEERPNYLKPEYLKSVSTLDPATILPELKLKGLRIQQLLDDPVTPKSAMDKIQAAAPKKDEVVRYDDWKAHQTASGALGVSGWLRNQLGTPMSNEN